MVSRFIHIIYKLATHSAPVDQQDGITWSMSEMQNLRPQPRPTESDPEFQQDAQVLYMNIHIWEELLYRFIYNCVPQIQEPPNWIRENKMEIQENKTRIWLQPINLQIQSFWCILSESWTY